MKKIFAILLASMFMLSAVSCVDTKDDGNENSNGINVEAPAENDNNSEPSVTTPNANEKNDISNVQNAGTLAAATSETFTEIIGYSMLPYNQSVSADKGMVEAITGYNGRVELTYHSFTDAEAAVAYFDEIIEACPGEQIYFNDEAGIKSCKKQDGTDAYMAVCIDNTILFGWGKDGFEELGNWFYALGYSEKN